MMYSLNELGLVDAPPESIFDNLTKLASSLFDTPVSLVSIVDFDNDRQFFKSQTGLSEPWATQSQTPLSHSFCQHVVNDNATLVIENAPLHPRVQDNLAIADLGVSSYLGTPIYNPQNEPIGAFCVIDGKPRQWSAAEKQQIERLSICVTDAIKLKATYLESESLRKEQADFTYAISHDLMSPAITLQGILEEISAESHKLSSDLQPLLKQGLGTLKRMRKQVRDVLQYLRTSEGCVEPEEIPLNPLIEEILFDLQGPIKNSGARIHVEQLPTLFGCRMQFRGLFQNLLSNAIKFCAPEQTPEVHISSHHKVSSGHHCIKVKDNGIGIDPEHQASIFQLFTRLHLHNVYPGSGIGLALCHRVMKNHGGRIAVSSDKQNGSTFVVTFPDSQS